MSDEKISDNTQLDLLSETLPEVIAAFKKLDDDGRRKLFRSLATIFNLETSANANSSGGAPIAPPNSSSGRFSQDRQISPKEFLQKKLPRTDVERVACLAYYLTHYREQQHFKTLDISILNTEAAQIKFSNAAKAVDNATTLGYLAQASKGNKQLSAQGELFVEALPDREAAHAAMANARPRRKSKRQARKES